MHNDCAFHGMPVAATSSSVQAQALRSAHLLNAIEATVSNLVSDAEFVHTMVNEIKTFNALLEAYEGEALLDPEGLACAHLERAAEAAERMYKRAIERCDAARQDKALRPDDGVVEAFKAYIAAAADLHNVLEDVRNLIAYIDALKSPTEGQTFSDAEALFAHLGLNAAAH